MSTTIEELINKSIVFLRDEKIIFRFDNSGDFPKKTLK